MWCPRYSWIKIIGNILYVWKTKGEIRTYSYFLKRNIRRVNQKPVNLFICRERDETRRKSQERDINFSKCMVCIVLIFGHCKYFTIQKKIVSSNMEKTLKLNINRTNYGRKISMQLTFGHDIWTAHPQRDIL